jgi:hypothetical protein
MRGAYASCAPSPSWKMLFLRRRFNLPDEDALDRACVDFFVSAFLP